MRGPPERAAMVNGINRVGPKVLVGSDAIQDDASGDAASGDAAREPAAAAARELRLQEAYDELSRREGGNPVGSMLERLRPSVQALGLEAPFTAGVPEVARTPQAATELEIDRIADLVKQLAPSGVRASSVYVSDP